MKRIILVALLCLAGTTVSAQQAGSTSSSSNSNHSEVQASNAGNAFTSTNNFGASSGVEYSGSYKVNAQVPIALGAFGTSFSSDNCANTTQGGITTPWASFLGGGPKESASCVYLRTYYAAGQGAAYANQIGDRVGAAKLISLANFALCSTKAEITRACRDLGLITIEVSHHGDRYDDPVTGASPVR